MIQEDNPISIIDYLEIAWRRRWFIIIPFLSAMAITIALCFLLPRIYKASTTILVIPQEVPDSFVRSTVTMNPSEYLNIITQQIMSRTRLEKVINELALFPDLISKTPMEKLIAIMQANIEIEVHSNSDRRGAASFTISYLGRDPHTVASTANRLSSLFIEENLKNREDQAKNTTLFLSSELQKLNITLEEHEKRISAFKQRYLGSLPEQRDANLRTLDQLILQRQRITDELSDTENRKILLKQQLLQSDSIPLALANEQRSAPVSSLHASINTTKRRLADLKNRYTASHPDVISTEAELKRLLAQANSSSQPAETPEEPISTFGREIDQQLLALDLEIKTLKNEDSIIKTKISDYQSRVEMAPGLEQQLASLTRDYQNTRNAYDVLMTKRLEAGQAEKLEINQQGEQFKVLDPAKIPLKPFKPDRLKLLLLGFMVSLGCGIGLACLMEYLDNSFYSVKDLESYLGLPVLASIPLVNEQGRTLSTTKTASL